MTSSPHSPSPQYQHPPLQAIVLAQPITSSAAVTAVAQPQTRRLPPPCWSNEETIALIDAYREKWYSLNRGNLKAFHWEEVAKTLALRCPLSPGIPAKTPVQCRHKMEKLRKRYRAEIQRAASMPKSHRYNSSWMHFARMDAMEKGLMHPSSIQQEQEESDDEEEEEVKPQPFLYQSQRFYGSTSNGAPSKFPGSNGVRIKIPGQQLPVAKVYSQFDDYPPPSSSNLNPNYGFMKRNEENRREATGSSVNYHNSSSINDAMEEMVSAITTFSDRFVKVERMKMETARELEAKRMEMEMKRTQMILQSQERILESFSKALLQNNQQKSERMPTSES